MALNTNQHLDIGGHKGRGGWLGDLTEHKGGGGGGWLGPVIDLTEHFYGE